MNELAQKKYKIATYEMGKIPMLRVTGNVRQIKEKVFLVKNNVFFRLDHPKRINITF